MKTLSLDEITVAIEAQDRELADLYALAADMPRDLLAPESFLRDLDDVTDPEPAPAAHLAGPFTFGVRG